MVIESGQRLSDVFVPPATALSDVTCEELRLTHDAGGCSRTTRPPSTNISVVSCESLRAEPGNAGHLVTITSRPSTYIRVLSCEYQEDDVYSAEIIKDHLSRFKTLA